tara:strand:+ start:632 stop:820 length:189 start_codon:yes stop_codon:yes gene_type:complete
MLPELFLALQLLDGVKQRDGMTPSGTQKPQEQFVEGTKDFIEGIKDALPDSIKNPFSRFKRK